jgi:hypothetical protein
MKGRIFVVILLVAGAAVAGRWVNRSVSRAAAGQDETRQTFRLEPGARVEVRGINGPVEVTTSETDTAEVRVVRTADSADDLEYGKVMVGGSEAYLSVNGSQGGARGLWRWLQGRGRVRQQVTLALPRRVEFAASRVNGQLRAGEFEGSVEVSHVNGRVEVAQASGRFEVSHVKGGVKLSVSRPGEQGLDVEHVNGNVEIRLKELVNADIDVERQNGALSLNVPNVTMQERHGRSNTRARLGGGGSPFQFRHVNGNVRFESDASGGTTTTVTNAVVVAPALDGELPPLAPLPPLPPAPPAP